MRNTTVIGTGAFATKENQLVLGAGNQNILVIDADTKEVTLFGRKIGEDEGLFVYNGLREWISMLLAEEAKRRNKK